jgi:hypothetical protein
MENTMTLEELMKARNGEWQGDNAVVQDQGGYFWIVAQRVNGKAEPTKDGLRLMGASKPAPVAEPALANTSTHKVESKKKLGKKPDADLDLDDL